MFHQSNPHTEVILDYVPGVIIPENCRLANKIYTGSDFFDQWATPIYSGIAY